MQLLLLLVAYILSAIILPIGGILTLILFLLEPKTFWTNFETWSGKIAISLDRFGNAVLYVPLNKWFIKTNGYQFGTIAETISGVFGVNKIQGTLRPAGTFICYCLDKIQKNHVENAANNIKS